MALKFTTRSRCASIGVATALVVMLADPVPAQDATVAAGAFNRTHPGAGVVLDNIPVNLQSVFGSLRASNGGQLPGDTHAGLMNSLARPTGGNVSDFGLTARANEVISRARALHRQILDIYASPDVSDPHAAAEAAIDAYLADSSTALPATPKDAEIMQAAGHAATNHVAHAAEGHAGHDMTPGPIIGFASMYPDVTRFLWAQQWLEIAAFEPVLRSERSGGGPAAMNGVVERFRDRLSVRDDRLSVMPTTVAISPELTLRHRRASIILNNLHMLEMAIADELSSGATGDTDARIEAVVDRFLDTEQYAIDENLWLRQSLRRSVYLQGGPAIGDMDRNDRNIGSPGDHRIRGAHPVMPG